MRRRPWPIVLLASFQFIEPVSNILVNAWLSHISPSTYLKILWLTQEYAALAYIVLLPIVMGCAIWSMKRWSYPVFLAGSITSLIVNYIDLSAHSNLVSPLMFGLLYAGNVAFVSYFLLPAVRKPYLDPRMRWWESQTRFRVRWQADASGRSVEIEDISEGGAFVLFDEELPVGSHLTLKFKFLDCVVELNTLLVHHRAIVGRGSRGRTNGYGVQFVNLKDSDRATLTEMAVTLENLGYSQRGPTSSAWEDFRDWFWQLLSTGQGLVPMPENQRIRRQAPSQTKVEAGSSVQGTSGANTSDGDSTKRAA